MGHRFRGSIHKSSPPFTIRCDTDETKLTFSRALGACAHCCVSFAPTAVKSSKSKRGAYKEQRSMGQSGAHQAKPSVVQQCLISIHHDHPMFHQQSSIKEMHYRGSSWPSPRGSERGRGQAGAKGIREERFGRRVLLHVGKAQHTHRIVCEMCIAIIAVVPE